MLRCLDFLFTLSFSHFKLSFHKYSPLSLALLSYTFMYHPPFSGVSFQSLVSINDTNPFIPLMMFSSPIGCRSKCPTTKMSGSKCPMPGRNVRSIECQINRYCSKVFSAFFTVISTVYCTSYLLPPPTTSSRSRTSIVKYVLYWSAMKICFSRLLLHVYERIVNSSKEALHVPAYWLQQ